MGHLLTLFQSETGWTPAGLDPFVWTVFTPGSTGVSAGQGIASATDRGTATAFLQATGANQPLLTSANGAAFDGSNDSMQASLVGVSLAEFWLAFAVVPGTRAARDNTLFEWRGAGAALPLVEVFTTPASGIGWVGRAWPNDGSLVSLNPLGDATAACVVELGVSAGFLELWVNGVRLGKTAQSGTFTNGRLVLATQANAGTNWAGTLYGVVGYEGTRDDRVAPYLGGLMLSNPVPSFDPVVDATLLLVRDTGLYTDTSATVPAGVGDTVAAWDDYRGGSNPTLTESTAGNRPVYTAGGPNGLPALRFTGGVKKLTATFGAALPQPYTVVALYAHSTDTPTSSTWVWDSPTADRAMGYANNGHFDWYAGNLDAHGDLHPADSSLRVVGCTFDGTDSTAYQNGHLVGQGSPGSNALGGVKLGAEKTDGGNPLDGWIVGFAVYPRSLSQTQHLDAANKLKQLCGVGSSPHQYTAEQRVVGGQLCQILTPTAAPDALVIYCHGYGESGGTCFTAGATGLGPIYWALLEAGHFLAASDMHALNWGNQNGQTDADTLRTYMLDRLTPSKTVVFGQSMGGMAAANICRSQSWARGAILVKPALSLLHCYDGTATDLDVLFHGDITLAYGIAANGSDYAAKTAGFDPLTFAGAAYAGKRFRLIASPSDTTVDKVLDADAFQTLVSGSATESVVVSVTGTHSDPSHSAVPIPADCVAFVGRC